MIFIYQLKTLLLASRAQEKFITLAEPLRNAKHVKTGQQCEISNAQSLTGKTTNFDEYKMNDLQDGNRGCLILGGGGSTGMEELGISSMSPQQMHL